MKKCFNCFLALGIFFSFGCKPQVHQGDSVSLTSRSEAGMFAVLDDVWSLLDCYEKKICTSVQINFGKTGLYFDEQKGANWFHYYFAPIELGTPQPGRKIIETDFPEGNGLSTPKLSKLSRERIGFLVKKYIKFNPEIEHQLQQFVKDHFKARFIIGVHYRGTDKSKETPRISYDKVAEEVSAQIQKRALNREDYEIFVATDEQSFLDFMKHAFPGKIIEFSEVKRSKNNKSLHMDNTTNQFEIGRTALMDCLILSKTSLLIKTSSNLSRWSTYFNLELEVVELGN